MTVPSLYLQNSELSLLEDPGSNLAYEEPGLDFGGSKSSTRQRNPNFQSTTNVSRRNCKMVRRESELPVEIPLHRFGSCSGEFQLSGTRMDFCCSLVDVAIIRLDLNNFLIVKLFSGLSLLWKTHHMGFHKCSIQIRMTL